jgi:hypothetical protein
MMPVMDKLVPAKTSDPRKARLPSTVLPLEVDHRIRPIRLPTIEACVARTEVGQSESWRAAVARHTSASPIPSENTPTRLKIVRGLVPIVSHPEVHLPLRCALTLTNPTRFPRHTRSTGRNDSEWPCPSPSCREIR